MDKIFNIHLIATSRLFGDPQMTTVFQYLLDKLADMEEQAKNDERIRRQLALAPTTIKTSVREIIEECGGTKHSINPALSKLETNGLAVTSRTRDGRITSCMINRDLYFEALAKYLVADEAEQCKWEDAVSSHSLIRRNFETYLSKEAAEMQKKITSAFVAEYGHSNTPVAEYGHSNTPVAEYGHSNTPVAEYGHSNTPVAEYGHSNTPVAEYGHSNTPVAEYGHSNTPVAEYGHSNTPVAEYGHSNTPVAEYGHSNVANTAEMFERRNTATKAFDEGGSSQSLNRTLSALFGLDDSSTEIDEVDVILETLFEGLEADEDKEKVIYQVCEEFWDICNFDKPAKFLANPYNFLDDHPSFRMPLFGAYMAKKLSQTDVFQSIGASIVEQVSVEPTDEDSIPTTTLGPMPIIQLRGLYEKPTDYVEPEPEKAVARTYYPYYKRKELSEFVNDIDKAAESPMKLFLYNLWGYLADVVVFEEPEDEDGDDAEYGEPVDEDAEKERIVLHGNIVDTKAYDRAFDRAYNHTLEQVNEGRIVLDNDEVIELSFSDLPSNYQARKAIDWKRAPLSRNEVVFEMNEDRIRDIEAAPIKGALKPVTKEERKTACRNGRIFAQKLWDDKILISKLKTPTRAERIVLKAIADFFQPNDEQDDEHKFVFKGRSSCLSRDQWRMLQYEAKKEGLKESDLEIMLFNFRGMTEAGGIYISDPMFSPEGIKAVNEIYGETSEIEY